MNHEMRLKIEVRKRQMAAKISWNAHRLWAAVWYPLCDASDTIEGFDSRARYWISKRK